MGSSKQYTGPALCHSSSTELDPSNKIPGQAGEEQTARHDLEHVLTCKERIAQDLDAGLIDGIADQYGRVETALDRMVELPVILD